MVLYVSMAGSLPGPRDRDAEWSGKDRFAAHNLAVMRRFDDADGRWDAFSESGKSFLRALLEPEPGRRMTAHEALLHPWIAPPPASAAAGGR